MGDPMKYDFSVKYLVKGQNKVLSGQIESDQSIPHVVSSIIDDIIKSGGTYINGSLELNENKSWFL